MKTKLLFIALLTAIVMPFSVHADENTNNSEIGAEIKAQIEELKELRQDLRTQIEEGSITKEEAKEAWLAALAEARAEKEAYFAEKLGEVKGKFTRLSETHPELAERLEERFAEVKDDREDRKAKYEELRGALKNGEITREEFREALREFHQEWHGRHRSRVEAWRSWTRDTNWGRGDEGDAGSYGGSRYGR